MTRVYDNWGRLVEATLKREQLREIGLANSTNTSFSSSTISSSSDDFSSRFDFDSSTPLPENLSESYRKAIHLADRVVKAAAAAAKSKEESMGIKSKTERLALLLKEARVINNLYDRPMRCILDEAEHVLEKALVLIMKCSGMKRVFTFIPSAAFRKMSSLLKNSIGDVSWLIRIGTYKQGDDDVYLGLPPVTAEEPITCLIWELVAVLYTGSIDDRSDAAHSLVSLARDNDRYARMIVKEGGVWPLLKLVNQGEINGQEKAAMAIGLLGKEPEHVEHMIDAGVCSVFSSILFEEGPMKVQATVAWAVSELANHNPKCQDQFAQHDIVWPLVSYLASQTADANMKAMAARALCHLAKGNSSICCSIIELRALFRLAILLERGPQEEVKYNCAMALMEITAVAEVDADLRKSTFKPNSIAYVAIVNHMLRVIENEDSELLLVPCIKALGNLATTFKKTEMRIISSLVKLLDEQDVEVVREACVALTKFACSNNYQHLDHSKAIISVGGAKHLVGLVYFGGQIVPSFALVLLCYITLHVPDREELAQAEVLTVMVWASKQADFKKVIKLLSEARAKLELYQSRG